MNPSTTPTLLESVEREAKAFRSQGTATGDFLASQLERLSQLIAWTHATTPADFDDRMEVYDRELRERHFDRGYFEGLQAGRRESRLAS